MYADDSIYSELNIDSETNMTLEATDKYVVTIYRGSASTATRNREIFHITGGSMKMGTKNSNLILDGNKDADKLGDNVSSMIYLEEGSFVMNGGKIQNCIADNGGAIYNAAGYIYLKNNGRVSITKNEYDNIFRNGQTVYVVLARNVFGKKYKTGQIYLTSKYEYKGK